MVATYNVFGRQVGSHILAMATLGTTFAVAALSMGGEKKTKEQGPPINATSTDEESFIKDFIKNAEAEEQKAKH
ncbi:MAG: Leukocyte receptor cluster (LRC) member 8 [Chaenotheca gracillima]|nr:MAG: Leukocyte receptor cluster (LRC) member 8 [Chaenotheca gracillima]